MPRATKEDVNIFSQLVKKMVKDMARKGIQEYEEFNQFMFRKQEQSEKKKTEFD